MKLKRPFQEISRPQAVITRLSMLMLSLAAIAALVGCGSTDSTSSTSGNSGNSTTSNDSGPGTDKFSVPKNLEPRAEPERAAKVAFGNELKKVDVVGKEASTGVDITFVEPAGVSASDIEASMIDGYRTYFETAKPPAFVQLTAEVSAKGGSGSKRAWVTRLKRDVGEEVDWTDTSQNFEKVWKTSYKKPGL